MTSSGEELTLKGETEKGFESVFSFNKSIATSYLFDAGERNQMELRSIYPAKGLTESFKMVFVIKGSIILQNEESPLQHIQINAQQHNLLRIFSKTTRMTLSSRKDEVICINLSADFLSRYLPAHHPALKSGTKSNAHVNGMVISAVNLPITSEIHAILQKLGSSSQSHYCDQMLLESKAIELLALQVSQFEQYQISKIPLHVKKDNLGRMHKAREILIHHTGEQLSLRDLAHLVGTNEFNLKRDFKAVFGSTVYRYLTEHKMEQAKTMLIEKDLTIAEIAEKVGYKYATHFSSAFKKHFGFLPHKIKSATLSLIIFMEDFLIAPDSFDFNLMLLI